MGGAPVNVRTTLVSLAVAVVSFLVVAIAVTELLAERIWPSLQVGIPAGFVAGVVAFVVAWYSFRRVS